jgi:hypothetical protein
MRNTKVNIEYENRVVAFIDILGFKSIILNPEHGSAKLSSIYDALSKLKDRENRNSWDLKLIEIEEDAQKKGVDKFRIADRTNCTCFSDSIVVSVKVNRGDVNEVVSTLIANLASFGANLMMDGILIRGAITIGGIIHSDNGVIMGPALIEAYELEQKIAKIPRIVLSKKLIDKLNYPLLSKRDRYPYHQYTHRFNDGCVGFTQLKYYQVVQSWTEMTNSQLIDELDKIKQTILTGLDANLETPDIYEKYLWLKDEYQKLIIIPDELHVKFYNLNEGISGNNIYFKTTDEFYKNRPK